MAISALRKRNFRQKLPSMAECRPGLVQRAVCGALLGAFVFALALSASPQLHERFHPDAAKSQHECVVTLLHSGQFHHAVAPPAVVVAAPAPQFYCATIPPRVWIDSLFLSARIFEHAPPA